MLEIKNINVHFGMIHALKDVSLTVNDGEIVTLIGANGAGKTTTLWTASGLKKPTSGSILLDGKDITAATPQDRVKMGISQVPEGRRVFSTMTVLENYLETFPGAIIAVSHDRYFLDRICNRIFTVEPGGEVREYVGGYSDYLESAGAKKAKQEKKAPKETEKPKNKKLKFSFKEQREYDTIEQDIAALEAKIQENQRAQMENGSDFSKLQTLMEEQKALEAQLEEKTQRWMYLEELAEKIANQ